MQLLNLKNPFSARTPQSAAVSTASGQRYRLTVICFGSERARVVDLLSLHLTPLGIAPQYIWHENDDGKRFLKTIATVACSPTERAVLVRFVNYAGMLPGVRSVRWESVPQAALSALR